MKKICLLFIVVLTVSNAYAQSSVDLYGRLEESINVEHFTGGPASAFSGTRSALSSDTSIWGLKGNEDLGGGLSAYFKLENGYSVTTGALANATQLWNRQAYVGLGSTTFGAIEFGRQYAPGVFLTGRTDPFGRAQMGAQLTLLQGSAARGYSVFFPSAVKYITPDFNGLQANVMAIVPGGQPLSSAQAVAVDYSRGPLYIGMEYDSAEIAGSTVGENIADTSSKTLAIAATYKFQPVKVFAYLQRNHIADLPNVWGYMLGVTIPVGFGEIKISAEHTANPGAAATLAAIGYDYSLSVRTQVYVSAARLNNSGKATFSLWPASQTFGAAGAGQRITGVELGIRHLF